MTDIVLISLEAWDQVWRRNQHLTAALLSADPELRLLFVEPASDPVHSIRTTHRFRRGRGLRLGPPVPRVGSGRLWLYEPTKWLPRRIHPGLDQRWAAGVESTAGRIGFTAPVLWVNAPAGAHVLELTGWASLYDITDDWLAASRPPAAHARLLREETLLLRRCQEVVVCSPALQRGKQASRISLIPNAVDLNAYRGNPAKPLDLPEGRVVVYVGTLHTDRLDVQLCADTAERLRPDGRLVMVGPDLLPPRERDRLVEAGVVFLGAKQHADVPAYLLHADVLVVPHVVDAFTDSLDPIKVYEYRAAARPVVATPVAGFRELSDEPRVTVAAGKSFVDAAVRQVREPLAVSTSRQEPVPTWEDRATQMSRVIARLSTG